MSSALPAVEESKPQEGARSRHTILRRLVRRPVAVVSLAVILVIYTSGLLASVVAPYDYRAQNLEQTFQSPSLQHWLGTDRLGRDMLTRIIYGARTAAVVSILAVTLGTVFGVVLGGFAGYFGRWVDTLLMRVSDILFAFPGMLLMIMIAATLRPRVTAWAAALQDSLGFKGLVETGYIDYVVVFGAMSFIGWAGMARLVRGQLLSLREQPFVEAALVNGASAWWIIRRHLLPNAMPQILVSVSMGLGGAVAAEVVLSWLGIGVQPPTPSWGTMIAENQGMLRFYPRLLLTPALVVAVLYLAFNLFGDALNDALNPRSR